MKRTAIILTVSSILGFGGIAAAAPATAVPTTTHVTAHPNTRFWDTYYPEYFNSEATCNAWGRRVTNPSDSAYIPGFYAYECFKNPGDVKWSMRVWRD